MEAIPFLCLHIRKKQEENPLLGEWRMYAALKQLSIPISPRTYGRILTENRRFYGIKPSPKALQSGARGQTI
jgi:hypothetical protein